MKILVISNMYPSDKDPSYGTFVRNFYKDLVFRNGLANTKLSTIKGRRHSIIAKFFTYLSFYTRLLGHLLFRNYDLIYVHTVTFPTPALRIASWFRHLPLIFNVHGDDVLPSNLLKIRLRNVASPLVRKACMIVAPSEYFKNVTCDVFKGLSPEKVFVSPSGGIDNKFFHRKTSVNSTENVITLGFVSRIDYGKGWETYLEAIKHLKDEGIACRGIMAGGGGQSNELREAITKNGLDKTISFIGPQSQDKLAKLYNSFDLFIFPSTRKAESLGLVGLEAMASGVPVIAANMAGPTCYVINGYNGYLFTPGDIKDLVKKIKEYFGLSEEGKKQLGENAYNTACLYRNESVARQLFDKITSIQ